MENTAQENTVQIPAHDSDLRRMIHPDAEKTAARAIDPADLDPEGDSSLEKIRESLGDAVHISGKAAGGIGESLGRGEITHFEQAPASKWRKMKEKFRKVRGVFRRSAN
jgi:hypothetical protein